MNFVLLTAVLSAANSGIYATSRLLFTMSQTGEAPKTFLKTTKKGIPLNGILLTTLMYISWCIFILFDSRSGYKLSYVYSWLYSFIIMD